MYICFTVNFRLVFSLVNDSDLTDSVSCLMLASPLCHIVIACCPLPVEHCCRVLRRRRHCASERFAGNIWRLVSQAYSLPVTCLTGQFASKPTGQLNDSTFL